MEIQPLITTSIKQADNKLQWKPYLKVYRNIIHVSPKARKELGVQLGGQIEFNIATIDDKKGDGKISGMVASQPVSELQSLQIDNNGDVHHKQVANKLAIFFKKDSFPFYLTLKPTLRFEYDNVVYFPIKLA